jgi:sugar (pentulose or hexulose) kinase
MLAMRRHSTWMGVRPTAIHATGGAAASRGILQVMADVFEAPVHYSPATDAAAVGAALRACQADTRWPWSEIVGGLPDVPGAAKIAPIPAHVTTYRGLQPRYIALEQAALAR